MWAWLRRALHAEACPGQARRVDAALARALDAQVRAGRAAEAVATAARKHVDRMEETRQRIQAATEDLRGSRPCPPTSEVRALMEETIRRMRDEGEEPC